MKISTNGLVVLATVWVLLVQPNCVGADAVGSASDGGTQPPASDGSTSSDGTGPADGASVDSGSGLTLLENAVQVSAGQSHTCAVTAEQDVLCWGANGAGQLGVPPSQTPRSSVPVKAELGGKAIHVAAGGNHTCAILVDGQLRCWGSNDRGQLGRGSLVATGTIGPVAPPQRNSGLWGAAEVLAAGSTFTCAGVRAGDLNGLPRRHFFCWGENIYGQLATRGNGQPITTPSLITFTGEESQGPLEGFTIASGGNFACAGHYSGAGAARFSAIGCWGSRVAGEIGVPPQVGGSSVNPQDQPDPVVAGLLKEGLLAAGSEHACAVLSLPPDNPLRCWGENSRGQAGSASPGYQPAHEVPGIDASTVSALAAGGKTTCVIASGQVRCIGANDVGQLGRGSIDTGANATFADARITPTASSLAVGRSHGCAVLGGGSGQKGQVACWGQNQDGQLGDGMNLENGYPDVPSALSRIRSTPVRVRAPRG